MFMDVVDFLLYAFILECGFEFEVDEQQQYSSIRLVDFDLEVCLLCTVVNEFLFLYLSCIFVCK